MKNVALNKKKVAAGLPKKLLEKLLATCGQGCNPVDRDLFNT